MKVTYHNFWKDRIIKFIPLLVVCLYTNRFDYKWSIDIGFLGLCISIQKQNPKVETCNHNPCKHNI